MNRDDIMRMALEAGGCTPNWDEYWEFCEDALLDFVALVAAAEREACAELCREIEEKCWETWDTQCDQLDQGSAIGAAHCAAAIRARGAQPPIG